MSNLRIGLPSKGRLSDLASELLKEAGIKFRRQNRSLFAKVSDLPIEIIFLVRRADPFLVRAILVEVARPGFGDCDRHGPALGPALVLLAVATLAQIEARKPLRPRTFAKDVLDGHLVKLDSREGESG